jgi:hypothetical protein
MPPEGATGMTGSSLAAIVIPLAATTGLAAWLTLVFYAGGHFHPAGDNPAPGREGPGTAAPADRPQPGARPADPGAWQ